MKTGFLLIAFFAIASLAGCAETQQPAVSGPANSPEERLARDFEQVAFYRYSNGGRAASTELKRAALPVRFKVTLPFYLSESQKNAGRSLPENALGAIRGGTGLDVGVTDSGSATFLIFNTDPSHFDEWTGALDQLGGVGREYMSAMTKSGCFVTLSGEPLITGAMIFIDAEKSLAAQSRCIYRGLGTALGITSFHGGGAGVFGAGAAATGYSQQDLDLIQMLYDPRLKPGMSAAQARPLLPAIASDALAR